MVVLIHKISKKVEVVPLKIKKNTIEKLEDNLCLYFTKFSRSADKILKQNQKTKLKSEDIIDN